MSVRVERPQGGGVVVSALIFTPYHKGTLITLNQPSAEAKRAPRGVLVVWRVGGGGGERTLLFIHAAGNIHLPRWSHIRRAERTCTPAPGAAPCVKTPLRCVRASVCGSLPPCECPAAEGARTHTHTHPQLSVCPRDRAAAPLLL